MRRRGQNRSGRLARKSSDGDAGSETGDSIATDDEEQHITSLLFVEFASPIPAVIAAGFFVPFFWTYLNVISNQKFDSWWGKPMFTDGLETENPAFTGLSEEF